MNKPGSGPMASSVASSLQKKRILLEKVDTEVNNMIENFTSIIKKAQISDHPVQNSLEKFQMDLHSKKMNQSAQVLTDVVSELKKTAIFSNFQALNEHVDRRTALYTQQVEETNQKFLDIAEQAAASLKALEESYYSSPYKEGLPKQSIEPEQISTILENFMQRRQSLKQNITKQDNSQNAKQDNNHYTKQDDIKQEDAEQENGTTLMTRSIIKDV